MLLKHELFGLVHKLHASSSITCATICCTCELITTARLCWSEAFCSAQGAEDHEKTRRALGGRFNRATIGVATGVS